MMSAMLFASLENDLAERKVVVIAGYTCLVLHMIDGVCHRGIRKGEHQGNAKHRKKPGERMLGQLQHNSKSIANPRKKASIVQKTGGRSIYWQPEPLNRTSSLPFRHNRHCHLSFSNGRKSSSIGIGAKALTL